MEGVQAIASLSKDTIPEEFIRSKHEQPASTTVHGVNLEVPVIDMNDPDEEKINRLIVEASREWGIFQVVNHGISSEVIGKLRRVGSSVEGYETFLQKEVQGKKGWVDHLFHKHWPPSAINHKFWPQNHPSYRFDETHSLASNL